MIARVGSVLRELRRRKVFRSAGVYLAGAFVVVQVVDALFPLLRIPEEVGTVVAALLIAGFPLALVVSWLYELTPEGLRREIESVRALGSEDAADPPPPLVPKALRVDSVAVLPFQNLSPAPENEYFSDGLTDDILAAVARIRDLRVLSRTSVMRYKGTRVSLPHIAAELGVATFVSGSVRRSGSRIRVVAEVVDARSDSHLWSETYDREIDDIFQIQSEVAASVARAVRRELSPDERDRIAASGTTNGEAYDLYLRARQLWSRRNEASLAESLGFFERALQIDPDFALAHAGRADALTVLGIYGARAPHEALAGAKLAAERALSLEPTLGEALTSLACVQAVYDWDWVAAEARFRQALEAAPSYATAHQWYAMNLLAPQGRFEEARAQLSMAEDLDPDSPAILASRGIVSFYAGDHARAVERLDGVARSAPGFGLAHFFMGQACEAMGDLPGAVECTRRAVEVSGDTSETLAAHAHALFGAGRHEEAAAIRTRLEARATRRYVSPVLLAQVALDTEPETALGYLEVAADARATDLIWLGLRPIYKPLRDTDRFKAVLARVGTGAAIASKRTIPRLDTPMEEPQ